MVKVSVIIPVYNVEIFLKKCIDSILNQTLDDIEVICIDDGSTDSSLDILNEYKLKDNRLIVLSQEHEGAAIARNKGIEIAAGEYISFVDSDDWLKLNALEKLYFQAKSNGSDLVLFNSMEILPNNETKYRFYLPMDDVIDYNNFSFNYTYNKRLVMNGQFVIWSKIYRTTFLKENNIKFQDYKIFNDVQFHIESMILAKKISYMPEIFYFYNKLNANSIQTVNSKFNKRLVIFDIFDDVKNFLLEKDLWDTFKINFYEFKIRESKQNLDRTEREFKNEFFIKLRSEFFKMNLSHETLKKLPFSLYRFYIHVLINESFSLYEKFLSYKNPTPKYLNKLDLLEEMGSFNGMGVNTDKRDLSIIISLTSFPERMYDIQYCLYSLFNQSFKPDKIILWLASDQFPNKEKDIPKEVLDFKKNGLSIKWCKDLKSYKKIIPALKEYPKSYIVTADDDIFYPKDWLMNLWNAYESYPNTIICTRTRKIKFDSRNNLSDYGEWEFNEDFSSSYLNFSTNGAGTLFFPNSLSEIVLDEDLFLNLCPTADDIWLWAMAILNRTKITNIGNPMRYLTYTNLARELNISDEITLWKLNKNGENNTQFQNILRQFPIILELIKLDED